MDCGSHMHEIKKWTKIGNLLTLTVDFVGKAQQWYYVARSYNVTVAAHMNLCIQQAIHIGVVLPILHLSPASGLQILYTYMQKWRYAILVSCYSTCSYYHSSPCNCSGMEPAVTCWSTR